MAEEGTGTMDDSRKPHRKRQAGPKYNKKKEKDDAAKNVVKPKNPKAFSCHSLKKTERAVRRAAELEERRLHKPVVHRQTEVPPPVLVAVVGPPKVGKTTLIRCLVKNFTGKNIITIKGPVTIVASKRMRLTFVECNNDLNSMIDLSKTADLVLLLSNASLGFEMEVFEFSHLVEAHGKMRMMGVLTHMDKTNNKKLLKAREKFWKKTFPRAKLYKLSKIIDTEYQKKEIENLGRFIEIMKYEPVEWRTTHPYVLVDRVEDMTDPNDLKANNKIDRTVCLYGYIRGTHFDKNCGVHLLGVGDFNLDDMNHLADPCPFPWEMKKRSLNRQERLVYAPLSGVGGVLMDKDALYLETATIQSLNKKVRFTEKDKLLQTFDDAKSNCGVKSDLLLFDDDDDEDREMDVDEEEEEEAAEDGDGEDVHSQMNDLEKEMMVDDDDDDPMSGDEEEDDGDDDNGGSEEEEDDGNDDDDDSSGEDDEETDGVEDNKVQLRKRGIYNFMERFKDEDNIQRFIYNTDPLDSEDASKGVRMMNGLFQVARSGRTSKLKDQVEGFMRSLKASDFQEDDINMLLGKVKGRIRPFNPDEDEGDEDVDDDFGDDNNEDMDCGDDDDGGEDDDDDNGEDGDGGEEEDDDDDEDDKDKKSEKYEYEEPETPMERRARRKVEKLEERKRRQKELFDSMYDDGNNKKNNFDALKEEMAQQSQLNMTEFGELNEEARTQFEGFRPGLYVRMQIKGIPSEFLEHFDPGYPLVVGGLLNQERNVGYITVNLNKHRWYKSLLKTDDPMTFSLGWRRFQTVPVYSRRDDNGRNRRVKYISGPGFQATFWGPLTPQLSGIAAFGCVGETKSFRISALGVVKEVDQVPAIQKKVKLCGEPVLIHKNTAFVQKMFNTDLEVGKFQNAQLKTVSGIRGQVKKSVKNGTTLTKKFGADKEKEILPGTFRATFEDKIKMSDIVFLTAWCKVVVEQFYNPLTNLLLSPEKRGEWKGMKTTWEIRNERSLFRTTKEDSQYKVVTRPVARQTELKIPRKLMRNLPFEFKPKNPARVVDGVKRVAIVREPEERKVAEVMKQISAIYEQKRKDKRKEMRDRAAAHQKQMEARNRKKGKESNKKNNRKGK